MVLGGQKNGPYPRPYTELAHTGWWFKYEVGTTELLVE